VTLNSSNLSWAIVAASVRLPPKALFFVVVVIRPANASKETAKITSATRTSISEKPFDFGELFTLIPPLMRILCKRHTNEFIEDGRIKNMFSFNRLPIIN